MSDLALSMLSSAPLLEGVDADLIRQVAAYLLLKIKQDHCLRKFVCSVDLKPISLTAQELGIARETLSRCLQRLVKCEGITCQRGTIQLTSIACLEAVLEETECRC